MKKKIGIALFVVTLLTVGCSNAEGENLFGVKEIGGVQSNFRYSDGTPKIYHQGGE